MRGQHCPRCAGCTSKTCRSKFHQLCTKHRPRPGQEIGIFGSSEFDVSCLPCGTDILSHSPDDAIRFIREHRNCSRPLEEE